MLENVTHSRQHSCVAQWLNWCSKFQKTLGRVSVKHFQVRAWSLWTCLHVICQITHPLRTLESSVSQMGLIIIHLFYCNFLKNIFLLWLECSYCHVFLKYAILIQQNKRVMLSGSQWLKCRSRMAKHQLTVLVSFHATDAPDTPQNLSCETPNFLIIKCTWKPGRPSGLYGERRTKYSLFER